MVTSPDLLLSPLSRPFTLTAQPLTVAEFRLFPGCGHYTETEAAEILTQLMGLAHLLHDHLHHSTLDHPS